MSLRLKIILVTSSVFFLLLSIASLMFFFYNIDMLLNDMTDLNTRSMIVLSFVVFIISSYIYYEISTEHALIQDDYIYDLYRKNFQVDEKTQRTTPRKHILYSDRTGYLPEIPYPAPDEVDESPSSKIESNVS